MPRSDELSLDTDGYNIQLHGRRAVIGWSMIGLRQLAPSNNE
jgi:hypothetical protein